MPSPATKPLRVFWSYSHADEDLRDKLDVHLSALKRANRIEDWHDRKIPAGARWRDAIDQELERADIILLLVSATFLGSEFCHSVELKRAIERNTAGDALVIPVMLRPCDVQDTLIADLQQLPEGGRPITKWGNRDEACQDVARRLRIAIEDWERTERDPSAPRDTRGSQALPDGQTQQDVLRRIFGLGESVTSVWLDTVRRRGAAVARLKRRDGQAIGSGFLVDPEDFGLPQSDAPHLLTCSFVVGSAGPGNDYAVRHWYARAWFEIADVERSFASVVWESPLDGLRTILLRLDGPVPSADPVPIVTNPWQPSDDAPTPRIVLVAHPGGRGLEFSLRDVSLVDADDWRVHYRAGTEGGSSGGLVLEEDRLRALAIHSSRGDIQRLHGKSGTYQVCEGISLLAIQRAVRASVGS